MKALKESSYNFSKVCFSNGWGTGSKARMVASYVWCQARKEEDIIYQTSLLGQRDIGEEIDNFIKRNS